METMEKDTETYITASELARRAELSNSYLARLCRDGRIPAQRAGQSWIISESAARDWLAERARQTNRRSFKRKALD